MHIAAFAFFTFGAFASFHDARNSSCKAGTVSSTCLQLKHDFPNITLLPTDPDYLKETRGLLLRTGVQLGRIELTTYAQQFHGLPLHGNAQAVSFSLTTPPTFPVLSNGCPTHTCLSL